MGKTSHGPRFVGFARTRERPVYNETTISYPDAFSVYSKVTGKKPPLTFEKKHQTSPPHQELKQIKVEPFTRQFKIKKRLDPIHEQNFKKNKSPLGVYLRRDNISVSPPRDHSF
jgi:hypothetical protein